MKKVSEILLASVLLAYGSAFAADASKDAVLAHAKAVQNKIDIVNTQ